MEFNWFCRVNNNFQKFQDLVCFRQVLFYFISLAHTFALIQCANTKVALLLFQSIYFKQTNKQNMIITDATCLASSQGLLILLVLSWPHISWSESDGDEAHDQIHRDKYVSDGVSFIYLILHLYNTEAYIIFIYTSLYHVLWLKNRVPFLPCIHTHQFWFEKVNTYFIIP